MGWRKGWLEERKLESGTGHWAPSTAHFESESFFSSYWPEPSAQSPVRSALYTIRHN